MPHARWQRLTLESLQGVYWANALLHVQLARTGLVLSCAALARDMQRPAQACPGRSPMSDLPVLPIYRPVPATDVPASTCQHGCGCGHAAPAASPAIAAAAPGALADGLQRSVVQIAQMDCPVEVQLIEQALGKRPEVAALSFNLLKRQIGRAHV